MAHRNDKSYLFFAKMTASIFFCICMPHVNSCENKNIIFWCCKKSEKIGTWSGKSQEISLLVGTLMELVQVSITSVSPYQWYHGLFAAQLETTYREHWPRSLVTCPLSTRRYRHPTCREKATSRWVIQGLSWQMRREQAGISLMLAVFNSLWPRFR